MIRMFGDQNTNDLAQQLRALEEEFQLKKMTLDEYENAKVIKNSVSCMKCTPWNCRTLSFSLSLSWQTRLLYRMEKLGHCLSADDKLFLENKSNGEMMREMEQVEDDS